MTDFEPHLFVSVGETGAMYTLRETYLHEEFVGGRRFREVRSAHLFNLSVDADAAFSKASIQAAQLNLRLKTQREDLDREMREIQRMSEAERKRREDQAREWTAANREQVHAHNLALIEQGIYPVGRFKGKAFHEADLYYITWLATNIENMESELMSTLATSVAKHCSHLILPVFKREETLGSIDSDVTANVIILKAHAFENRWGKTSYITSMVTLDGVAVVVKSSTFRAKPGQRMTICGKVKQFTEYNGQAQTQLKNVKKLS